jgi:hypothetical protein
MLQGGSRSGRSRVDVMHLKDPLDLPHPGREVLVWDGMPACVSMAESPLAKCPANCLRRAIADSVTCRST